MSDLERRLRAAMLAASEQAPPALMQKIRRRHRRHVRRVGSASVAAVAAVAIIASPVLHALRAGPQPGGPAATATGLPRLSPAAAPGTGLRTCRSSDGGSLSANWQAASVRAGPVWFIWAGSKLGWPSSRRLAGGKLSVVPVLIAVRNGSTVVLTGAPPASGHLEFLPYFDKARPPLRRDQAAGVTFVGCPAVPLTPGATIPESYAPGLTLFWIGYITDLRRCLPFEVRTPAAPRPVRVTLPMPGGTCAQ
jgi:hypothetical protein